MRKNWWSSAVQCSSYASTQTYRQTDRQTDRQTNKQTYSLQYFAPPPEQSNDYVRITAVTFLLCTRHSLGSRLKRTQKDCMSARLRGGGVEAHMWIKIKQVLKVIWEERVAPRRIKRIANYWDRTVLACWQCDLGRAYDRRAVCCSGRVVFVLIHFCTWISLQPPFRSWTWLYHKKATATQNDMVHLA